MIIIAVGGSSGHDGGVLQPVGLRGVGQKAPQRKKGVEDRLLGRGWGTEPDGKQCQ